MPTSAGMDISPDTKEEYLQLLDRILRTDLHAKSAEMLENAIGLKRTDSEMGQKSCCCLSEAIKCINSCVMNLQHATDCVLNTFKGTSCSGISTTQASQTMLNTVIEAVAICRRIHENAQGLHVVADFLRSPQDINILNFSRTGRIPIPDYTCNANSNVGLAWLHSTVEKWIEAAQLSNSKVPGKFIQGFTFLTNACLHLRNSSDFASQVFRVLMYCNPEGKSILQGYIRKLNAHEVNDIITELQNLRRKYDQVNILMEQLGWVLADILTKLTGKEVGFEALLRAPKYKLQPFGDVAAGSTPEVPEGVKNLKKRIKAGLKSIKSRPGKEMSTNSEPNTSLSKRVAKARAAKSLKRELDFKTKLAQIFGIKENVSANVDQNRSGTEVEHPSLPLIIASHNTPIDSNDPQIDNHDSDQTLKALEDGDHQDSLANSVKNVGIPLRSLNKSLSGLSTPGSGVSTPMLTWTGRGQSAEAKTRNRILSKLFQEQLDGITHMMSHSQATAARASFDQYLRQNAGENTFEIFKRNYEAQQRLHSRSGRIPKTN